MKQLNCSITGKATDTPYLTVDNGHIYHGVFESPTRCIFMLPDSEPPWGFTYFYGGKAIRGRSLLDPATGVWVDNLPPDPGAYESNTINYAPALARLIPDGKGFSNYIWAMMSGFCDYQLFLIGGKEAIRPQLQQARDLGSTGRRVLGMMAFITSFDPRSFGDRYYDAFPEYAAFNAEYNQRLHFDVFADNQVLNLNQRAHWDRFCNVARPIESVVIGAGNEYQKNGFDPFALPYPGVISSQGSSVSDTAPPMPGWGIRMWHGRRAPHPKEFNGADDMIYVTLGLDSEHGQYAPVGPGVHDEPMGAAEIDIPGRRSTDPSLFRALMLTGKAYGGGATFHSESGIYSRLLGRIETACAHAFFDAQ